ncbi:MAG: hypothetical protein ACR2QJ_06120 [Geminicoccaceae bacterium]
MENAENGVHAKADQAGRPELDAERRKALRKMGGFVYAAPMLMLLAEPKPAEAYGIGKGKKRRKRRREKARRRRLIRRSRS